jgi:hypothetical protein
MEVLVFEAKRMSSMLIYFLFVNFEQVLVICHMVEQASYLLQL